MFRLTLSLVLPVVCQLVLIVMYNPYLSRLNHGFPFHSVTDMDNSFFPRQSNVLEKYTDNATTSTTTDNTKQVSVTSTLDKIKELDDKGLAVNITDIYTDIKVLGSTLSSHISGMQMTMRRFQILLDDWDVEEDEGDQSYKND